MKNNDVFDRLPAMIVYEGNYYALFFTKLPDNTWGGSYVRIIREDTSILTANDYCLYECANKLYSNLKISEYTVLK